MDYGVVVVVMGHGRLDSSQSRVNYSGTWRFLDSYQMSLISTYVFAP